MMRNLTKTFLGAASLLAMFAGGAHAQEGGLLGPDVAITGAVAVQSDYRFRGIAQNAKEVSPEATLNILGPEGFYAGTWVAKTNWGALRPSGGSNNPSYETDVYFGKHTSILDSDLNIEGYYYAYPDFNVGGGPDASFFEIITQLSHTFGPVSATATWAYSPEFALGGGTGNYLAGNLTIPVNDWLSVSGNLGHQWVQAAKFFGSSDYTHGDIGATLTYKSLSLDLRYVSTDLGAAKCGFYMGTTNACSGGFTALFSYNVASWPW
jgi:uncharacterized protein (TIGR02001 family)